MTYRFYDYGALEKQTISILNDIPFAISDTTYKKVIDSDNIDLMFFLFNHRNKYDVCYKDSVETNDTPEDVAIAASYEKMCHPDELIFVTTNKEYAKIAGNFFGEDSIQLIK